MFTVHLGRRAGEGSDDEDFESQSVASLASTGTHSGDEGWYAFDTCMKSFQESRLKCGYFFYSVSLNINLYSTVDGFEDGEADFEDNFEQILADNIDGATQRRCVCKIILFIPLIPLCLVCCSSLRQCFITK